MFHVEQDARIHESPPIQRWVTFDYESCVSVLERWTHWREVVSALRGGLP